MFPFPPDPLRFGGITKCDIRIHKAGKELVHDASSALAKAFGTEYDRKKAPILGLHE